MLSVTSSTARMPPLWSAVGPVSTIFVPPTVGSLRPLTVIGWVDSQTGAALVPTLDRQSPSASITPKRTALSQTSTVHLRLAGVASVLPAASVARTSTVCRPPSSSGSFQPAAQGAHATVSTLSLVSLSRRHSNVESGSDEVELNVGVRSVDLPPSSGPTAIAVSGASASTVKARAAGVESSLPSVDLARTFSVYAPEASLGAVNGVEQRANGGTEGPGASILHSKVAALAAVLNVTDGVRSLVSPSGPAWIPVSMGLVSTVNARVDGLGSTLRGESTARTENV